MAAIAIVIRERNIFSARGGSGTSDVPVVLPAPVYTLRMLFIVLFSILGTSAAAWPGAGGGSRRTNFVTLQNYSATSSVPKVAVTNVGSVQRLERSPSLVITSDQVAVVVSADCFIHGFGSVVTVSGGRTLSAPGPRLHAIFDLSGALGSVRCADPVLDKNNYIYQVACQSMCTVARLRLY